MMILYNFIERFVYWLIFIFKSFVDVCLIFCFIGFGVVCDEI